MCSLEKQACFPSLQTHARMCTSQHPFIERVLGARHSAKQHQSAYLFKTTVVRAENMLGLEKDVFQFLSVKVSHWDLLLSGDRNLVSFQAFKQIFLHEISF